MSITILAKELEIKKKDLFVANKNADLVSLNVENRNCKVEIQK